ncbi:hypothetical protein [Blastococcus sp. TF02A-30]|uniref:hypothetical protein n=1 Tax=Blastococcus sp. TF02A-30 TaxID=2250580 RepID=UPI001F25DBA5|nr:hypothetical protein [Blastococcus sp. TF02A-30]
MTTCPSSSAAPAAAACRPTPAERARTVALQHGATVCAPGVEGSRVLAHAVTTSGRLLLVVPADGDLATAVRQAPGQDLSALLMVSDHAPSRCADRCGRSCGCRAG